MGPSQIDPHVPEWNPFFRHFEHIDMDFLKGIDHYIKHLLQASETFPTLSKEKIYFHNNL